MPKLGLGLGLPLTKISAAGFSPASIPGLQLWLKADAGVTTVGGSVTLWADQSPNGNDVAEVISSPTFESNVINGLPSILFDGARLDGNDIITAKTIYAVVKGLAYEPSQYAVIVECTGGGLYSAISGTDWGSYFGTEISSNDTLSENTPAIIASLSDAGSTYSFRKNGSEIIAGSNGEGFYSRSALYIGNDGVEGQPADVYVSEIIIYDNLISEENIQKIEEYLNTKYAIY
jgi:hypothetical protein